MSDRTHESNDVVDALLFAGRIVDAMMTFRDRTGLGLGATIERVGERIEHLKNSSPERFTVPLEGYGRSVYT